MALIVKDISKSYDGMMVLDSFSAVFEDGGVYAVMGSSGSGKTTLIHIIMGLVSADSGTVRADGSMDFGVVFQENRLCEELDALDNIKLVLHKEVSSDFILSQLKEVGITEPVHKPVSAFSGGMKRRVAIVRALLSEHRILIMDEPFKGLDEELREDVIRYVKKMRGDRILILVTHDKEDVKDFDAEMIMIS